MNDEQIAELRRLAAAATPLPWKADWLWVSIPGVDLDYIAAACNAVPTLLDEIEAARAEIVRLATALESFGGCHQECARFDGGPVCDCGFKIALDASRDVGIG